MITLRLRHILLFTITILLTACQFEDDQQCPDNNNVAASYINLTITVSNGNQHGTRAGEMPASGEDGDGREAGFERENAVTGITLILYQDANGINTTADPSPTLDLVRYFPVTKVNETVEDPIEAKYTTGLQLIGKYGVAFAKEYHAIVIANYDMTGSLTEGTSTLNNVRDATLEAIYSGGNDYKSAANLYTNFIMSSEQDNILDFTDNDVMTEDASGDKIYNFDDDTHVLVIERMAARIDFWAKGANYQTKNGTYDSNTKDGAGAGTYITPGYVFPVWKSTDSSRPTSTDRFVVTRITPFNLNAGTEFLLKRTNDTNGKYLAVEAENGTTCIIDPSTSTKKGTSTPSTFVNALSGIASSTDLSSNDYCHTITSLHGLASASSTIDSKENIVICYPMENTLPDESPLYYYATGIAIEGDYYIGDNTTDATKREHRVYFGYIRHQGDAEAYDALLPTQLDATLKTSDQKPMNFGIVRNNIYRISIDKVIEKTLDAPRLKIKIEETKWRHVDNPTIYI